MAAPTRCVTCCGGIEKRDHVQSGVAVMKGATKVLMRRVARAEEAKALREVRHQPPARLPAGEYLREHLPLSFAPYRLQAADRWWHEVGSASVETTRKRNG
jgi:hypothetical protein